MNRMTTYSSHGSLKSKVLMGMVGGLRRGPRMGRGPEGPVWAGWEQLGRMGTASQPPFTSLLPKSTVSDPDESDSSVYFNSRLPRGSIKHSYAFWSQTAWVWRPVPAVWSGKLFNPRAQTNIPIANNCGDLIGLTALTCEVFSKCLAYSKLSKC